EIGHGDEPVVGIREPALMDDQPGVDLAALDRAEDQVVAKLDHLAELGLREPEEQIGRRLAARDRDARVRKRPLFASDDERPDAVPEGRAAPPQAVSVADAARGSEAQLRQLQVAGMRTSA